jgi:colanic acid/amylovoran biosynthesis glycosyltransferase
LSGRLPERLPGSVTRSTPASRTEPDAPSVLHYMAHWLPRSEPFVHAHVTNSRYRGVVVASRGLENADLFPYRPVVSLESGRLPPRIRRYVVTARLMRLARRWSAGVVHVHHGYCAYEVIGTCHRLALPLVVSLHGHDITGYATDNPGIYDTPTLVADAVIVPSRFLAGVAAEVGFPAERIHVIPSGVDTTLFTPTPLPDSAREVLFVGRFIEKKGLDTLIAAWPSVRRQVPDARLRVLGFGPLEQLARSLGDGVDVVLEPDHETVREAMRRAYVVASPSHTAPDDAVESLLIVNLEAQASGRPVVTTRHGAIPEFVLEGETALVVPEADPRSLAEALVTILRDHQLARRLASRGPEWVSQFDAKVCAQRVDELYDSLVRRPAPRATNAEEEATT